MGLAGLFGAYHAHRLQPDVGRNLRLRDDRHRGQKARDNLGQMRADERRHQQHGLGIGIHRIVGSRADVVHQPLGHSRIHGEEGYAVVGMANAFLHHTLGIGREGQH